MTTLATLYRPRRFADVVGQAHIKPILRAMVKSGHVPPALLFSGSRGTGKTTTARIVAAALNCENPQDGDACTECVQCVEIQHGRSMSVLEIDAASTGGVEDIRKIKEIVGYTHSGEWRVVMLDEAHSMSKEAFNALLKVLEEPPPQTVFILLTTEAGKIIETVLSRSMTFEFRRLSVSDIVDRLTFIAKDQAIEIEPALVNEIALRVQGGMRDAVMLLDQVHHVGVSDVAGFRELFGIRNVSVALFRAALDANHPVGASIIEDHFYRTGEASGMVEDLVMLVRDLLVLRSDGELVGLNDDERAERQELAARVGVEKLVETIRVLWELKDRTRSVDPDQRASMLMAFVMMADVLQTKTGPISQSNGSPPPRRQLSVSQMEAMAKARQPK